MRKGVVLLLIAGAAWIFLQKFEIQGPDGFRIVPRDGSGQNDSENAGSLATSPPPARAKGSIRMASFNIQVFGTTKASKPQVMDLLARIVRQFDIVAVQEVRSVDQDIIPTFVDLINLSGARYDYVIGPRLGRTSSKEQYAFIYDMTTVEVDRSQLYTVYDPDDLLLELSPSDPNYNYLFRKKMGKRLY